MKKPAYILGSLLILFFVIQLIPVNKDNPSFDVEYDFEAPVEVKEIIVNSCFDCHSNQTNWPWYSNVAPVSWLVVNHVNEGREHLNFSQWLKKSAKKREKIKEEMIEEIEEGEMPTPGYVMMHPSSDLTDEKLLILKTWAFAKADSI